jgi:hypothetical protein
MNDPQKGTQTVGNKIGSCEVTPQAPWPIAKSLIKRDGPKATNAVHGPSGITYQPKVKAKAIAVCLEKPVDIS